MIKRVSATLGATQSPSQSFFARGVDRRTKARRGDEKSLFGLSEISQVLGVGVSENLAVIPCVENVRYAKLLGQGVFLYPSTLPSGEILSVSQLERHLGREILFRSSDQVVFSGRTFFEEPIVENSCWRITSEEPWGRTVALDYLKQTDMLCWYVGESYSGTHIPEVYLRAIDEFRSRRLAILKMMSGGDLKQAAKELVNLSINRLLRETAGQAIYRLVVDFVINGRYLLDDVFIWTRSLSEDGAIIRVGYHGERGISIGQASPSFSGVDTSLCISTEIVSGS